MNIFSALGGHGERYLQIRFQKHGQAVRDIGNGAVYGRVRFQRERAVRVRKKITVSTTVPQDILLETEILRNAPQNMIAAGAGDMFGKYTSLLDWEFSKEINEEAYREEIAQDTRVALEKCMASVDGLPQRETTAIESLTDCLILSGVAMQRMGNSRPASGSEHHTWKWMGKRKASITRRTA